MLQERAGLALSSRPVANTAPTVIPAVAESVFLADAVFTPTECDSICAAVRAAAASRSGGWDTHRHSKFRTSDLPLSAAASVEPLVRAALFSKLLRPFCAAFFGPNFLPEELRFRDVFYVRYAAGAGGQTGLGVHVDGSAFSVNLLLSDPADFTGGGTYFEAADSTLLPQRGCALGHSGTVRHGGVPITSGERLLLVGFMDVEPHLYGMGSVGWAAFNAYCKFGEAAWRRGPVPDLEMVIGGEG